MSTLSYTLGVVASLATFVVVIELLRRRRLRERHAVWWLAATVLAVVVGVFPGILEWAANLLGVGLPSNLVFFVSIAVLVLVCIQHSSELTDLEGETRALVETAALLELRVRELESALADSDRSSGGTPAGDA
ncbi:DUF2304 domain-containing protein [Agromyces protaetiae]|uniref:DUF2304 domain-containing protein n=1 Tax=Agromyces protaetiae TaxID=2509455 RepID=A0A4P6FF46_9MICO|nr:DUF2304 domain-containing protein [Agromyces protaetiae]QAY74574.1 DUF2304 domain-containing protein [Agromyces protaetiae]